MSFPERHPVLTMKLLTPALAAMLAMFSSLPVAAVALGEPTVRSSLGQKLDAEIDITSISTLESESLTVRLAPPAMFAEAGLDFGALQRSLRVSVEKKADRSLIHLSSDLPVADPFLILLIEVNTAGNRTIRQYALLLDPPVVDQDTRNAVVESPSVSTSAAQASSSALAVRTDSSPASTTRVAHRGDTLAKFAREALPPGATLEQALVAFFRANPTAFDGKNIHRMKTGSVLRVPDHQAVAEIPVAEARREVALQTADFQRYREVLARSAAQPVAPTADAARSPSSVASTRSSSGKIGVKETQLGDTDRHRDQLTLEPAARDNPRSDEPQQVNHRELTQIATEKALADAHSRIAELEKNVDQLQQLLGRDQSLSVAQERADQTITGATAPNPDLAVAKSPDSVPPQAKPVQTATAVEDPGFADYLTQFQDQYARDPMLFLFSLGALVAASLMLWLRSRLKKRQLPAAKIEPNAESQSVFGQAGGRNIDTSNSVFHSNFVPSVSQLDANEVDAIAEADVYIAYGRDEQAEEILLDALKHYPQRHALRVKLLEIYLARKDVQQFGAVAAELRVTTHGQGPEWEQAAQMGQQLDPGNLLYGGAPMPVNSPAPKVTSAIPSTAARMGATGATGSAALSPTGVPAAELPTAITRIETTLANAAAITPGLTFSLPVQPSGGAVRPEDSLTSTPAINDFGIRLEGFLDERRTTETGLSLAPRTLPSVTTRAPDFQLSGLSPAAIPGGDDKATALALKTKIDLALACQEIGDKEAARDLLSEVAGTRHPEFAGRAESLLQQLA